MALRKTLGDISAPECIAMMRLIETQSKATLSIWAIRYAKERYLPIYETFDCNSELPKVFAACERYLAGESKLAELKPLLRTARTIASGVTNPTAQAAARAAATACAVITTPTNAFGFLLYGAAAYAYQTAGTKGSPEIYNALASEEFRRAYENLKLCAVENEPNPAKINWGC